MDLWVFNNGRKMSQVLFHAILSSKNVSSLKENRSFVGFGVIFGRLQSVLEDWVFLFKLKVDFRTLYGSEIRRENHLGYINLVNNGWDFNYEAPAGDRTISERTVR